MRDDIKASRRNVLRTGLTILAGGIAGSALISAARADDAADSKVEQSTVMYQNMPKDGAKCSGCTNFVAPNACKVVQGNINPEGWCVAYAPKGS